MGDGMHDEASPMRYLTVSEGDILAYARRLAYGHLAEVVPEHGPFAYQTLFVSNAGDLHLVYSSAYTACYVVRVVNAHAEVVS